MAKASDKRYNALGQEVVYDEEAGTYVPKNKNDIVNDVNQGTVEASAVETNEKNKDK